MKNIWLISILTIFAVGCTSTPKDIPSSASEREPAVGEFDIALNWPGDKQESLQGCGGQAWLRREEGNLYVVISNAKNCSNVLMNDKKVGKLEGGKGEEKIALNEKYGDNKFVVRIESNKGSTAANIRITSHVNPPPPKARCDANTPADFVLSTWMFGRSSAYLPDCGGYVTLYKGQDRRVHLSFTDVKKCSNFDILSANGSSTRYKENKIGSTSNRSEDYVIPAEFYDIGDNFIKVVSKSNSGSTCDVFKLHFYKLIL